MKKNVTTMLCCMLALFGVRAVAQTATLRVWADDMTMTADGQTVTRLTVYETDAVDYSAFNMAFILPKGVSVAKVKKGRVYVDDVELNADRFEGLDHSIAVNMPDETTLKVMCYSNSLSEIYPDDADGNTVEELFSIGLVADPSTMNGEYEVRIVDCAFTPAEGHASELTETVTFNMTVTGGTDGSNIHFTLNEGGYGTLILPFEAELPEGLSAFRCTGVSGSSVLTEQQLAIPANTPLLMAGTPGSYVFTGIPTNTENNYTSGIMTGVYKDTPIASGYVLQCLDGVMGFYPVDATKPITVPSNRCYIEMPQSVRCLELGNLLTAISDYTNGAKGDAIHDLQGRRLTTSIRHGVQIRNGNKVIVE